MIKVVKLIGTNRITRYFKTKLPLYIYANDQTQK